MRYIDKQPAPAAFTAWKAANGSFKEYDYNLLDSDTRAILKQALINEQGGLCAYTGLSIDLRTCHVEHLKAQTHCKAEKSGEDLDYQNMVACYPGPNEKTKCGYGAHPKDDWPKPKDRANFVSPLSPTCEEKFGFNNIGAISAADAAADKSSPANQTIERLKLGDKALVRLRHDAIYGMLEPKLGQRLNLEQAEKRLKQLQLQNPLIGTLDEFCFALKQVLQNYIADLKQRQAEVKANSKPSRTKKK